MGFPPAKQEQAQVESLIKLLCPGKRHGSQLHGFCCSDFLFSMSLPTPCLVSPTAGFLQPSLHSKTAYPAMNHHSRPIQHPKSSQSFYRTKPFQSCAFLRLLPRVFPAVHRPISSNRHRKPTHRWHRSEAMSSDGDGSARLGVVCPDARAGNPAKPGPALPCVLKKEAKYIVHVGFAGLRSRTFF